MDLIENKALDETDFILADSFVPITFYLDEEHSNLVFSSVCSFGTGEISIRLNDKRFSYFDSDTQQYMRDFHCTHRRGRSMADLFQSTFPRRFFSCTDR